MLRPEELREYITVMRDTGVAVLRTGDLEIQLAAPTDMPKLPEQEEPEPIRDIYQDRDLALPQLIRRPKTGT